MKKVTENTSITLRNYLNKSALFLEGVENLEYQNQVVNSYCGINVSKTNKEPIDQIQIFIAAKRIQNYNLKKFDDPGKFILLIAGIYEILNAKNQKEAEKIIKNNQIKEKQKAKLCSKLCNLFDIKAEILTTKDLWQDQEYWNILKNLFDNQIFTRGLLINDALKFYESKNQLMQTLKVKDLPTSIVNLPLEFIKKNGNYPAPLLYTPAEVTEAFYLQKKFGINTKIGQAQERPYDKYLYQDLSVFRLKQPVSLNSSLVKPQTVTPYIDKNNFELSNTQKYTSRIYFQDSFEQIQEKITQSKLENYVFAYDKNFGEILNPILEKTIFAVESTRALDKKIKINNLEINSGQELINLLLSQKISLEDLRQNLAELIFENIIKPLKKI